MWDIAKFEISYLLRRPATYVYFVVFFLLTFLFMTTDVVQIGGGIAKIKINSPFVIFQSTLIMTIVGVVITTALAGTAVIRDFQFKMHELFYTKPITKASYLGGRFIGVTLVMFLAYSGILAGLMLGELMPWLEADKLGDFQFASYVSAFVVFIVPNVLFITALFFAVGTLSRSLFIVYIQGILLLILQIVASTITSDLENEWLSSLIDPFGGEAFGLTTRYWTVFEKNTLQLSFFGEHIFANRMLWLAVGFGLFALTYVLFEFNVQPLGSRKKRKTVIEAEDLEVSSLHELRLPAISPSFDFSARLSQFWSQVWFYYKSIVVDLKFIAIAAIGFFVLGVNAYYADEIFGTTTWPLTYIMIETIGGFTLFLIILLTIYAGEIIGQERELRLDQTFDSLNLPNAVTLFGKFSAVVISMLTLFLALIPFSMFMQAIKGYFSFEIGLYLQDFLYQQTPRILGLSFIVFLIHTIVNNKFIGHILVVAYFLLQIAISQLGLEHGLFDYGHSLAITYSDMNGWGPYTFGEWVWNIHWFIVGFFFLWIAYLFWKRGTETSVAIRLELARQRLTPAAGIVGGTLFLAMLGSGSFIYYNTAVLNEFRNSEDFKELRAEFEKTYKSLEDLKTPKVVDTYLEVDLYPEDLAYNVKGYNVYVNKTDVVIDSLILNWDRDYEYRWLGFDRAANELLKEETYDFTLYHFTEPLNPGDSVTLNFDFKFEQKGFGNSSITTAIAANGTFLNSGILPSLGYNSGFELSSDSDRKEQGLEPKERTASLYDTAAYVNNALSNQADWVDFEAVLSTKPGQIAIAPGYLQRQWEEDGRAYFHYKMDAPILYFFSFLSADYELVKDTWNDVNLEIYHHASHNYNTDRMMEAMKKSFDYFTEAFGPYQFKQMRILEFPRYATFAQSFPNTVPFSERIGFIARLKDPKDIDYPFYVTAHELAHQWFGHQIVGAGVQGSTMLIETFAQYGALMVMKHEYGTEAMKKFLRYELNSYLSGRSVESKKELPLMLVENQQYIHYRKGSLVMYALQDYLGEDLVNDVIKGFVSKYKFQEPPYTTTADFVNMLKEATPDSMQYLVEDWFETITLYENRTLATSSKKLDEEQWEVEIIVDTKKLRADSLGQEQTIAMQDWVDIGVFGQETDETSDLGKQIVLERYKLTGTTDTIRVIVQEEPVRAGVDPYNKLIDRNPEDNTKRVTAAD